MKLSLHTHAKMLSHCHLQIWMASFFVGRVSEAQFRLFECCCTTNHQPIPFRTDVIPGTDERPHDNVVQFVLTKSWQIIENWSSTKTWGKNPWKELICSLSAVLFAWGHWTTNTWILWQSYLCMCNAQQCLTGRGLLTWLLRCMHRNSNAVL